MNNLTIAQKLYLAALLAVAAAWIGLQVGVPIYEYNYGKSPLTALLAHLSNVFLFAGIGIVVIGWVLQSMGILPAVWSGQQSSLFGWSGTPVGRLRNLALWIVIALVLVFVFNLVQGTGGSRHPNPTPAPVQAPMPDLMAIFINWFPMLLIFGVWLVFLRQMKARQGNNNDKPDKF